MAKFKPNIDLTRVKHFLLATVEKIALGVALAIGGLLVFNGLAAARRSALVENSDTLLVDALESGARRLDASVAAAKHADGWKDPLKFDKDVSWKNQERYFPYASLMAQSENGDFKRRNPVILAAPGNDSERTNIQIDYVPAGVLVYDLDRSKSKVSVLGGDKKNEGGNKKDAKFTGKPVVALQPRRMVVVHAMFPMKEQILEYAKQLRMSPIDVMKDATCYPHFRGLDVIRIEKDAKGEVVETRLYWHDSDRIQLAGALDALFREAFFDENTLKGIDKYRQPGLMTPLPKLASGAYPAVALEGVKPEVVAAAEDDDNKVEKKQELQKPNNPVTMPGGNKRPPPGGKEPGPNNPPQGQDTAATGELRSILWGNLGATLKKKFEGEHPPFDPGAPPADKKNNTGEQGGESPPIGGRPPVGPPLGGQLPPGGQQPGAGNNPPDFGNKKQAGENQPAAFAADGINNGLIRFLDVDVEPGKTYSYKFRVRAWNPNYGKKDKVAFAALADIRELVSLIWTYTPAVTIPEETFYYAVDQTDATEPKKPHRGPDTGRLDEGGIPRAAPIQIHRWLGKVEDGQGIVHHIGDWVIAERLLVRRGEYIGRRDVIVQVPTWNKFHGHLELVNTVSDKDKKAKKAGPGIALDFTLGNPGPGPMLIDFSGGPRQQASRSGFLKEDAAMELLIMNPDGKLVVRNMQSDTDDPKRIERYDEFRRILSRLHQPPATQPKNDPGKVTAPR